MLPTEPLNEQAIRILSEMSVRVTKLARKIGSKASLCFRSGIVTLSISTDALDADEFAAADVWSNAMARAIHTGNENEVSVGRRGRTRMRDRVFQVVLTGAKSLIRRSTGRANVILFHRVFMRC